jgi:hypothetical protein
MRANASSDSSTSRSCSQFASATCPLSAVAATSPSCGWTTPDFVFYTGHANQNGRVLANPDDGFLSFSETDALRAQFGFATLGAIPLERHCEPVGWSRHPAWARAELQCFTDCVRTAPTDDVAVSVSCLPPGRHRSLQPECGHGSTARCLLTWPRREQPCYPPHQRNGTSSSPYLA